jgi:hypothetical protein
MFYIENNSQKTIVSDLFESSATEITEPYHGLCVTVQPDEAVMIMSVLVENFHSTRLNTFIKHSDNASARFKHVY